MPIIAIILGPPLQILDRRLPLRIAHLFLWTACSAVCLAAYRHFREAADWRELGVLETAELALLTPFAGASLGGFLLLSYRRVRGYWTVREPGELLLFIDGLHSALWVLFYVFGAIAIRPPVEKTLVSYVWYGWRLATSVVQCVLFSREARHFAPVPKWRRFFRLLSIVAILHGSVPLAIRLFPLGLSVFPLRLVLASKK